MCPVCISLTTWQAFCKLGNLFCAFVILKRPQYCYCEFKWRSESKIKSVPVFVIIIIIIISITWLIVRCLLTCDQVSCFCSDWQLDVSSSSCFSCYYYACCYYFSSSYYYYYYYEDGHWQGQNSSSGSYLFFPRCCPQSDCTSWCK